MIICCCSSTLLHAELVKLLFFQNHFRDVDDVHDMMDDISEQTELANEISEAISSSVGFGQDIDEVGMK